MAPENNNWYIHKLPYNIIKELCRILDRDNKWEELAGIHMKFDMFRIDELRRFERQGESPTRMLLSLWGQRNHTVTKLFILLSEMHHYQAMLVLKPLVDARFHPLLFEGEEIQVFQERLDNGSAQPPCSSSKTMGFGSVNINTNGERHSPPDKVMFPKEPPVERKIQNVATNNNNNHQQQHNNSNNSVSNGAHAVPQAASQENNITAPNVQRKVTNVSDASVTDLCMTIPKIAYNELMIATDNWSKANILGKGGFGTVFKGNWKNTLVAIKRIEQRGAESAESYQTQMDQSLRELRILNACRHDNILPVYGFSVGGAEPCLVYQYMPNGSLEHRLMCKDNTVPLTWLQRLNIAIGTARGLQFLHNHEKPFIHGDIKSANILLNNNLEPRIGDFGLAREGPQTQYTHMHVSRVQGTLPYLPEEFLRSKMMSTKVDTFSFGIVLFELGTGLRAYDENRQKKLLKDHALSVSEEDMLKLRDCREGSCEVDTFLHLMNLGKWCVSQRAMRPKMEEVLMRLENVPSFPQSRQYPLQMTSAASSMPYRGPGSVSPEPATHMGMNVGHVSPVYLQPPVHHNNPILYVNNGTASDVLPAVIPQPVIAISPPSNHQPCSNVNVPSSNSGLSESRESAPFSRSGAGAEAAMAPPSESDVLPLITALGITARSKQLNI